MEAETEHQHITAIVCSNGTRYSSLDYIIQPFSQNSFLVRQKDRRIAHSDGTETQEHPSKEFVIIPTRVVDAIFMEDCQHAKANAEPKA